MKTKFLALAFLMVMFFMQGCIPSLHPLYTEDKLVFVEDLLGTWGDEKVELQSDTDVNNLMITSGDGAVWNFEKHDEKTYRLIHKDEDDYVAAFNVHLVKLGKHYFMDFFPTEMPEQEDKEKEKKKLFDMGQNSLSAFHYLPVHTFAKLELTDNELLIHKFNAEWLDKLFEQNRIRIKHEKTEDGTVLTASPEELQKFVLKYADEPEAFIEPDVLKRLF